MTIINIVALVTNKAINTSQTIIISLVFCIN